LAIVGLTVVNSIFVILLDICVNVGLTFSQFVGKMSSEDFQLFEQFEGFDNIKQPHRDEYHLFFLQEKGTTTIEIDFHGMKL